MAESMLGTVQLFNDLKNVKTDLIDKVDSKIEEVDSLISEAQSVVSEGAKTIDSKVKEFEDVAIGLIKDIKSIEVIKGDAGADAEPVDEEALEQRILSKIPAPVTLDEKALTIRVLKAIPENKASLKVIRESVETDPISVIEKIMALAKDGKFKLPKSSVDGLEQTMSAFNSQLGRGYLHGGGDTVKAGTGITITTNPAGQKVISASGGGTGTVTSVSVVTANGISGSVATSTTTPAITLTLGSITPSNVLISGQTASRIAIFDGTKNVISADTATYPSLTELSYVKGVTSSIQTQINSLSSPTITIGTTTITSGTTTRILYDNAGVVGEYTLTGTGTVVAMATSPTFQTSINGAYLTASTILISDGSSNIISAALATYPSLTELSYVKGVTSAIQTQLNSKGTGTVTAVSVATANGFSGSSSGGATPALTIIAGAIVPTSVNGLTISTTTGTFTLTNAKTLAVTNSLTLSGTDSTVMTFPTTTATIARTDAAQTFTGIQTFSQVVTTNNAITASSNAATVPITSRISTVTNDSANAMTITIATTSAVDGMIVEVRILDFSAATKAITWVNTENSTVSAPTTSNGSTTLPLSVLFQYNGNTSKWRCLASS